MKPILLAACASALVVPPRGLAQRRRTLVARRSFFDEDSDADDPWATESHNHGDDWADAELGGVRVQRLVAMTGVGAAAYTTYILGSEALVLACSFYLLESFVDDLEDPFGGSWTVDAALGACDELVDALAVEE